MVEMVTPHRDIYENVDSSRTKICRWKCMLGKNEIKLKWLKVTVNAAKKLKYSNKGCYGTSSAHAVPCQHCYW